MSPRRSSLLGSLIAVAAVAWVGPRAVAGSDEPDGAGVPACKPLPRDKRIVKLDFKPDSALTDVIGAYAAMSCKRIEITGNRHRHKVTVDRSAEVSLRDLQRMIEAEAKRAGVRYEEDDRTIRVADGR